MNYSFEKIKFKKFLDKNSNRIFEGGKRFNSEQLNNIFSQEIFFNLSR